jgi:putative spermidine/putrescine transport system substrate-binding protein
MLEAWRLDCVDLLVEERRAGLVDRRGFLCLMAALGASGPAFAHSSRELVLANWGGPAIDGMMQAYGPGIEADIGVKLAIDSSGPSAGRIRQMVESGRVVWDVCDSGVGTSFDLGRRGLLEPIDYTIVDKSKMPGAFAYPWGCASSAHSNVLAWDSAQISGEPPRDWADFWDVAKHPGKRAMWRSMFAVLEAALMADGVPAEKIYPIDVKRAFAKVREIRPHMIFWRSGGESEQLLRSGEVTMGNIWSTRAKQLVEQTGGRVDFTWTDGIVTPSLWVVPKGNPSGKLAQKFIARTLEPERQILLLKALGGGPTNPAASDLVPAELKRFNPTDRDNLARQTLIDGGWYADNYAEVHRQFLDLISA